MNAPSPGDGDVVRVVCVSVSAIQGSVFEQMERIRQSSLARNASVSVHAVLIHQSGWFIYWAEGPLAAIHATLRHIHRDPRHHGMRILHRSRGKRHLTTPWSMALVPDAGMPEAFGLRVARLQAEVEHGQQHSPTSVIRRLSAPMLLPAAQSQDDPDSFYIVGVCSAGSDEAFGLVRWLARENDVPCVRRRFSGVDDLDTGSDYVDFMDRDQPCRVIAVARQGLSHGLRRAFLPDWPLFLVLFSGSQRHDNALLDRLVDACEGLPRAPRLLGIAPDAETHLHTLNRALASELDYTSGGVMPNNDFPKIWQAVQPCLDRLGPVSTTLWDVLDTSFDP